MKRRDLTNEIFGRLTVIGPWESRGEANKSRVYWFCRCSCRNTTWVSSSNLTRGNTSSCGCLHKEVFTASGVAKLKELRDKGVRWVKHDMTGTPVYRVWCSILDRCYRVNGRAYRNYGGRGITICPEWRHDFLAFYNYVGEPPTPWHSIDRYPNNDGNYEPGNVRWATAKEQSGNQRPRPPRPPKQPKLKKYRQIIR